MAAENLAQTITSFSNIVSQNSLIIIAFLIIISILFSKRKKTLIASLIILVAILAATIATNTNGLAAIEIAIPLTITMTFFASQAFYPLIIISIIIMLSAPSITMLGAGVSIGIITPFIGETIINKIEELGWIIDE